jgi:hypothetical protein
MLRLRDKNSHRNEASCRLSKIPDPLCSLPEAGLAPHCIGHLEAVASVALLSVMLSTIGWGNRWSNVKVCLTSSLACEA